MFWRITDKTLPYAGNSAVEDDYSQTLVIGFNEGGLYDAGSNAPKKDEYYCWSAMKDSDMFGGNADIYNGCDYVRVWDQKGIHTAAGDANYWGVYPTAAEKTITPKIYFGADFGTAFTPMEYSVNSLTIELFYE